MDLEDGMEVEDQKFDLLLLLGTFAHMTRRKRGSLAPHTGRNQTGRINNEGGEGEDEEEGRWEEVEEEEEVPGRLPALNTETWVGQAAVEGDMINVVALLENVVCRACVVPDRRERTKGGGDGAGRTNRGRGGREEKEVLTSTALNVHDGCVKLSTDLYLGGYAYEGGRGGGREGGREEEEEVLARTLCAAAHLAEEEGEEGRNGSWRMMMMEHLPETMASPLSPPSLPASAPSSLPSPSIPEDASPRVLLRIRHREGVGKGNVEEAGGTIIVDPGALADGHFAVVTLGRGGREGGRDGGREGGWMVRKVELERLPSFRVGWAEN
jgi:hypothetical protein